MLCDRTWAGECFFSTGGGELAGAWGSGFKDCRIDWYVVAGLTSRLPKASFLGVCISLSPLLCPSCAFWVFMWPSESPDEAE
jgi:hypothetical protein